MNNGDAIGMIIKQINDELQKRANNLLRASDLTLTQSGVLATLNNAENNELTLKELERAIHVSQPTAHGIVRRLMEKKLVDTYDDRDNRRIKHVKLTAEGKRQAALGQEHMAQAEAMLTKNLSEDEVIQFRLLLGKVRRGLD